MALLCRRPALTGLCLQQALRKEKRLDLESELLAAGYHFQDGHTRVGIRLYNQDLEAESGFIHMHGVGQHTITRAGCTTAACILPTSQTLDLAVVERAHLSGCSFGNCVCRVRPVKRKKECKRWECQDAGGPLTQTGRKMKKCSSWRRRGEVRL